MADERPYNLAIETSSRQGSVTLGWTGDDPDADAPLETVDLPQQRRHAIELMPTIDALCRRHGLAPRQVGEVYISIGPGSFTGLRIGVTTAKLLAHTLGCRLVAVPTLDVVVANAPTHRPHLAVLLNAKRGQCYTGLYDRTDRGWQPRFEPALMTPAELVETAPRPLALIGDLIPEFDRPDDLTILDHELAIPRSEVVRQLGRDLAAAGRFADPVQLTPLYVRLPEPEEKYRARHGQPSQQSRPDRDRSPTPSTPQQ